MVLLGVSTNLLDVVHDLVSSMETLKGESHGSEPMLKRIAGWSLSREHEKIEILKRTITAMGTDGIRAEVVNTWYRGTTDVLVIFLIPTCFSLWWPECGCLEK